MSQTKAQLIDGKGSVDLGALSISGSAADNSVNIDSSSRLLVGTSSTSTALRALFQGNSNNASGTGVLQIATGNASPADAVELGRYEFGSSTHVSVASIVSLRDGGTWTAGSSHPSRLVFSVTRDGSASPTEALRISNTGYTSIAAVPVTGQDPTLRLTNNKNVSGDFGFASVIGSNCNNTSSYHAIFATGGTDKYYIYGNGTTGTPSDNRLKKNIETARNGYLDDLNQLRVVKYNWNEQEDGDPKELGVIAQEVEAVFPGLIQSGPAKEDGTSYKGVKTSVLPFMLLKALQEATVRIESLEAEVAALKGA